MNPLEAFDAAIEALGDSPHDFEHAPLRQEFENYLVGALSVSVDAETWATCLGSASRCIEADRKRRATQAGAA